MFIFSAGGHQGPNIAEKFNAAQNARGEGIYHIGDRELPGHMTRVNTVVQITLSRSIGSVMHEINKIRINAHL